MLDPVALARAVDLQRKSYALLRWTVDGIGRGFLRFDAVHQYATRDDAAFAWLRRHHADFPPAARPDLADLPDFARLFTTYVDTSFDLVEHPGKRLHSPDGHCLCPCCAWLVDLPRLQAKKLTGADKKRARALERGALFAIAAAHGLPAPDETLAEERALREDLALVAWARDLFDRLRGSPSGPATLALWRTFAWKREGSPKPGFEVSPEVILAAEARVLARLRAGV